MARRMLGLVAVSVLVGATSVRAADEKLAFLIPHLFGPTGLIVDSEATLLLRNAALGEASGVAAGSAVLPTPPLAGGSDPQAGREPLVSQQR